LTEPFAAESRQLLREYVNLRLEALDPANTDAAIVRSEQIHDELWSRAETLAREDPGPAITLYITSLNEVIDLHTERLVAELGFRVPPIIVNGLYIVAVLTMMLVGVHNSYRERHNLIAEIIVVLILSVVFLLIVDLDRSHLGIMKIPQEALIDLQQKLITAP
jgi:hypothetical protein